MGTNVGTAAFVVVTIGGLGSFWGAVISGLLVGEVISLSILLWPPMAEASMYVLMIIILLLRPRGLLGEKWERFD
jgi:branched-chain amino acid transport system permease protein